MHYEPNLEPTLDEYVEMLPEERAKVSMAHKLRLLEQPAEPEKKNENMFFGEQVL